MESIAKQATISEGFSRKLELFISCKNLKDVDFIGKSDPYVIVSMKEEGQEWKEIGKTEMITNNLNPTFETSIIIDYFFERH
jgi:Ca2+-dependent lipid-binding protein